MFARGPRAVLLLACTAVLAPTIALTDPRGIGEPPPPLTPELLEARRLKLAQDMAAWLPRMVGRFQVDGIVDFNGENGEEDPNDQIDEEVEESEAPAEEPMTVDPQKIKLASGKADCTAIGQGPGVHCVFHVSWIPEWTPLGGPVDGGEPFLAPAMKLFGLDPNTPLILQLQLDTDGVAELESTTLKGNTVKWIYETRCESNPSPVSRCRRVTRFYAPARSNRIQLVIEFEQWANARDWVPASRITLDMVREVEDQVSGLPAMPGFSGLR